MFIASAVTIQSFVEKKPGVYELTQAVFARFRSKLLN